MLYFILPVPHSCQKWLQQMDVICKERTNRVLIHLIRTKTLWLRLFTDIDVLDGR